MIKTLVNKSKTVEVRKKERIQMKLEMYLTIKIANQDKIQLSQIHKVQTNLHRQKCKMSTV